MRTSPLLAIVLGVTVTSCMAGDLQILFPLYSYPDWYSPSSYIWAEIASANATVPITAIINPDNGPGGPPNSDFLHGMADLEADGVSMIGYVSTDYGLRSLSDIESDISLYASSYPGVIGIFLDEESTSPSELSFYETIRNYTLTKTDLTTIIANPGTNTPESYISAPTANTTVLFESGSGWDSYATDGYVANYPRSDFAAVFYNLSSTAEMESAVNLAQERNFGYVFATDGTGANPYNSLPSYWTAEVNYVAGVPEPSGMALAGIGALWLVWRSLRGDWARKWAKWCSSPSGGHP